MPFATIALGANLPSPAGPPDATLAAAADRLSTHGRIAARSSLYSTAPVGSPPDFVDQPSFVNAVLILQTAIAPHDLLESLLAIERDFGRDRATSVSNGPRTLDLDLLFYGDFVLHQHDLDLPHPRIAERAFVLVPLQQIAPALCDPRTGVSVSEWLQALRTTSPQAPNSDLEAIVEIISAHWRPLALSAAGSSGAGPTLPPHHG